MSLKDLLKELALRRQKNDAQGVANVSFKIGDYHLKKGKWEDSLQFFQEAFEICHVYENRPGEALAALGLSEAYFMGGDFDKSIEALKGALQFYEEENDFRGSANVSERLGDALRQKSDHHSARRYYQRAMDICNTHNDQVGVANMNIKLGLACLGLGGEGQALNYFEDALSFYEQMEVPDKQAFVLAAIGQIFQSKEPERALKFMRSARELYKRVGLQASSEALDQEISSIEQKLGEN